MAQLGISVSVPVVIASDYVSDMFIGGLAKQLPIKYNSF